MISATIRLIMNAVSIAVPFPLNLPMRLIVWIFRLIWFI